ncbi:hypothetical protein CROQUDRAFT_651553 [Cronartium quercuum f. sp. fusiforme G11]|uniref:Bifunctional lycopene cyclase/phytoene synthase n=1 Tax=Cronartium quercuum f. sp. fusiforme G11 TaxID=708437 RepID=A0A9P6NWY4_9BASI|nr:hypothetical protein CROQUDRAFT_651553 [Cronartium quercuum f. sp. fusiforme G11]
MLMTYWVFHLCFTLPPAFTLHALLKPILSTGDTFRFFFLSTIAVLYTLPWDSYIIHHKAWSYAPWAVTATIFKVPIEEVFFFVIQTILTGYLYTLFTFPLLPALYLLPAPNTFATRHPVLWAILRWTPSLVFAGLGILSWTICQTGTHLFYLTCIGFWAMPICSFLWAIAGDHVLLRPSSIFWSTIIPTIYLCSVDTIALRRGIWSISAPTSLGIFVWPDLPLEEAIFFLVTNFVLVLGLAALEKTEAIADTWPELVSSTPELVQIPQPFSFQHVLKLARTVRPSFDLSKAISHSKAKPGFADRPTQLSRTLEVLRKASKSFYSASLVFSNFRAGRAKFIVLYGFCRETDDLIDHAPDVAAAREAVALCRAFLDLLWPKVSDDKKGLDEEPTAFEARLRAFVHQRVPAHARPTFLLFASLRRELSRGPFDELIDGYAYDALEYSKQTIEVEEDLIRYARWVAGSVGEMCVELMWAVEGSAAPDRATILTAANDMGVALQLVNIARDIREDATAGRVYLPTAWFTPSGPLTPAHLEILRTGGAALEKFPYGIAADRLLQLAASHRTLSAIAIERLPVAFRPGVRAATEVYLAIGAKLRAAYATPDSAWTGQRVFLSHFQRLGVVAREIWGFPRFKSQA